MAARIVWLDQAKDDLRAILEFIAAENPPAAARYVAGISQACGKLADFPKAGRAYDVRYRVLVFRNHLVFYRFDESAAVVRIHAVIDGRRDIGRLLGRDD